MGWRHPINYDLSECEACTCEWGQEQLARWERAKAAQARAQLERLFRDASIPERFDSADLAFYARWFRQNTDPEKHQAFAAAFTLGKDGLISYEGGRNVKSLAISGPYGTGKTFLATAILKAFLSRGVAGAWLDYHHLLWQIQAGYSSGDADNKLTAIERIEVLLIDDFGKMDVAGSESEDKIRLLEMILNYRINHRLTTIITSNMTDDQFISRLGIRLFERFKEEFANVTMGGRNLREEPLKV